MADRTITAGDGKTHGTLAAAEAAENTANPDITAGGSSEQIKFLCSFVTGGDTTAVDFAGWTTDATFFIEVESDMVPAILFDASEHFIDADNNRMLDVTGAEFTRIINMQFRQSNASAYRGGVRLVSDNCRISQSKIINTTSNANAIGLNMVGTGGVAFNNIIRDWDGTSARGINSSGPGTAGNFAIYNDLYNCTTGVDTGYNDTDVLNNALADNGNDLNGTYNVKSHNATFEGAGEDDGANGQTLDKTTGAPPDFATEFVDAPAFDFTPTDTDSVLVANATPISSPFSITTDFLGNARDGTNPDIGAIELQEAAGATASLTLPQFTTDFAGHSQVDGDITLPQLSLSAFSSPGIASLDLPQFTVDSTALSHGVSALDLPVLIVAAADVSASTASSSLSLPQLTTDFRAHLDVGGSVTLPQLSLSASDIAPATATLTLPMFTLDSTSLLHGVSGLNLPLFTPDFAGHLGVDGSVTLPLLSVVAGQVPPSSASLSLPIFNTDFAGHLGVDGAITLPQFTVVAGDTLGGDITLPIFTLSTRVYRGTPPDCVVMNTKISAVSEYNDYAFNSYARFNGVNLAANPNGIYAQDTTAVDDGAYKIKAAIKSGQVDTYDENVHRLRNGYINYESDGNVQIVTKADGSITRKYALEELANSAGINERRVKFERGIKDRFFDFKIENVNGSSMEIESMRVLMEPIIGKKG